MVSPISERLDSANELRGWVDAIPLHYEYTAGVAGEAFLRGLIDGKILAGFCPNCESASLPARMYCVDCYSKTTKFVPAGRVGVVRAITKPAGAVSNRAVFGFIQFPGVKGGLVHRIIHGARVGSKVRAVFKPKHQRVGAISDVLGFERSD
jgi:uncharacterized protein